MEKTAAITSLKSREQIFQNWEWSIVSKGTVNSRGVKAKKNQLNAVIRRLLAIFLGLFQGRYEGRRLLVKDMSMS